MSVRRADLSAKVRSALEDWFEFVARSRDRRFSNHVMARVQSSGSPRLMDYVNMQRLERDLSDVVGDLDEFLMRIGPGVTSHHLCIALNEIAKVLPYRAVPERLKEADRIRSRIFDLAQERQHQRMGAARAEITAEIARLDRALERVRQLATD